ncbi:RdgB/HAM1 family non-canonical purine NTP pyrophosphatase [Candidatus Uhrbacteria bacterium]|nr:RdgB/HAM1 family non-canonical purine NTP pyrophosphatase [Candidatus Uhrbacteria bacterium]
MKLIFATRNQGKVKEMRAMLGGIKIEVIGMEEAGVSEEVIEDRKTFEGNALKKARFVASRTGEWVLAEDSGLCIKALGGAPGVYSARWAGEGASDEEMVRYALEKMRDIPEHKRAAWFKTALAVVAPDGKERIFRGRVDGLVSTAPRGTMRSKLPYDMIFIPKGHTRTFAEMSDAEKNSLSHRGRAFARLKEFFIGDPEVD